MMDHIKQDFDTMAQVTTLTETVNQLIDVSNALEERVKKLEVCLCKCTLEGACTCEVHGPCNH